MMSRVLVSTLAAFVLIFGCPILARPQTSISDLLPQSSEVGGWRPEGALQLFTGEELFSYIDGGAEIYYEYGFRRVLVQDYRDRMGQAISLEIFEMLSPQSAYGIYRFKTSRQGRRLDLGDECQLADYYLNLWKGHFLITITGLDAAVRAEPALLLFARSVEHKIKENAAAPPLALLLPKAGLIPQSLKYFRGPLGLYNVYPFFSGDVFAFRAGVKGDYDAGYSLFVFEYAADSDAAEKYAQSRDRFARSPRYENFADGGDLFSISDSQQQSIVVFRIERHIVLVLGEKIRGRVQDIRSRLEPVLREDDSGERRSSR
jgi:hypothetical protein